MGSRLPASAAHERVESEGRGETASDAVVVLLSGPKGEDLRALGRTLVEERLAACVSVLPGARSLYRWEGEVCEQEEALAILKTTRGRLPAVEERVLELHPYEVPEFLALEVTRGSAAYLEWMGRSVAAERVNDGEA